VRYATRGIRTGAPPPPQPRTGQASAPAHRTMARTWVRFREAHRVAAIRGEQQQQGRNARSDTSAPRRRHRGGQCQPHRNARSISCTVGASDPPAAWKQLRVAAKTTSRVGAVGGAPFGGCRRRRRAAVAQAARSKSAPAVRLMNRMRANVPPPRPRPQCLPRPPRALKRAVQGLIHDKLELRCRRRRQRHYRRSETGSRQRSWSEENITKGGMTLIDEARAEHLTARLSDAGRRRGRLRGKHR
jgi:hypothetical protein